MCGEQNFPTVMAKVVGTFLGNSSAGLALFSHAYGHHFLSSFFARNSNIFIFLIC